MPGVTLFEDHGYTRFLPLTFWRSVFELRIGRKIFLDQTAQLLARPIAGVWTRDWIANVAAQRCGAPANKPVGAGDVLVNGRWICDGHCDFPAAPCVGRQGGQIAFIVCDEALASRLSPEILLDTQRSGKVLDNVAETKVGGRFLEYPWDVVGRLGETLCEQWDAGDASIESSLETCVPIRGTDQLHVGERTNIHSTVILDAEPGPIYISDDVTVGPYAVIEGPAYIGPGTRINPHTWLHGANAIGPVCKVGGEIDGCIICSYTNKQHSGFLGHAYVGTWVNMGAGATNSDLKNTYGHVRVPLGGSPIDTGETFFGAVIGDHAKIGINATIPTGAVFGFAATIAGGGMAPKFVRSFGWCTDAGQSDGDPGRLLDIATRMMARRQIDMTDEEIELFLDLGSRVRNYENCDENG